MSLIDRVAAEGRESHMLAPYAMRSADSRGRKYIQKQHPLRTDFQRDRDRLIHSAAFRRMEYKTQVFLPHEGDHFRTRLTHTIEVAQVARTVARCLGLNEDLTEAVALAHDLGHTPFGHSGEDVLNELLTEHGGFNHNRQSLRVVDILEQRYLNHPGLNLTYEVREGIAKHETSAPIVTDEFHPEERPTLEAALVDLADEIAYNAADTDDALNAGLIAFADLESLRLFESFELAGIPVSDRPDHRRYAIARRLVDRMAGDLIDTSASRIAESGVADVQAVRDHSEKLVSYSDEMAATVTELKAFLRDKVYRHNMLGELTRRSRDIIRQLFAVLKAKPEKLPERFHAMLGESPIEVVVADYIAGMTDRFAEHQISILGGK